MLGTGKDSLSRAHDLTVDNESLTFAVQSHLTLLR
jgi:hypothetical protein